MQWRAKNLSDALNPIIHKDFLLLNLVSRQPTIVKEEPEFIFPRTGLVGQPAFGIVFRHVRKAEIERKGSVRVARSRVSSQAARKEQ
jgi:hypothetical protein